MLIYAKIVDHCKILKKLILFFLIIGISNNNTYYKKSNEGQSWQTKAQNKH